VTHKSCAGQMTGDTSIVRTKFLELSAAMQSTSPSFFSGTEVIGFNFYIQSLAHSASGFARRRKILLTIIFAGRHKALHERETKRALGSLGMLIYESWLTSSIGYTIDTHRKRLAPRCCITVSSATATIDFRFMHHHFSRAQSMQQRSCPTCTGTSAR
jgi:hypothetical protein